MWTQVLHSDGAGLVINERLLNCPPQLASPLHHSLFDEEIPWAVEDEPTEELRDSFKFKGYLFISRVYRDNLLQDSTTGIAEPVNVQSRKPRKRQKVPDSAGHYDCDCICRMCHFAVQVPQKWHSTTRERGHIVTMMFLNYGWA